MVIPVDLHYLRRTMFGRPKIRGKSIIFAFTLTCGLLFPFEEAFSQDDQGKDGRGRKEQLKKQEKKEKEAEKAKEEAKEKHMEMQSDRTQRELKQLDRRSNRWNRGRRKFFLVRWYERIRHKFRTMGSP